MQSIGGLLIDDRGPTWSQLSKIRGLSSLSRLEREKLRRVPSTWLGLLLVSPLRWVHFFKAIYYQILILKICTRVSILRGVFKIKYLPEILTKLGVIGDGNTTDKFGDQILRMCSQIGSMQNMTPHQIAEGMTPHETSVYMVDIITQKFQDLLFKFNISNNPKNATSMLEKLKKEVSKLEAQNARSSSKRRELEGEIKGDSTTSVQSINLSALGSGTRRAYI